MKSLDKNKKKKAGNVNPSVIAGAVLAALLLFVGVNSVYTINEWEQAVITQFGEVRGEPVTAAGLHFKMPYHAVQIYDKRLLRWDGSETRTITRDRKTINLDVTARWRVSDAKRFRESIQTVDQADSRLNGIIAGTIMDKIAEFDLYEVIRSTNQILQVGGQPIGGALEGEDAEELDIDLEEFATLGGELEELRRDAQGEYGAGRPVVLDGILAEVRERLENINLGIHVEDVLIKQLNYTTEIESNVYDQMNAELAKISAGFRSHGNRRAETRLGEMQRELDSIESNAIERAQILRGQAEATSIEIYADAFNRSPGFYQFLRGLETYEKILNQNGTLIIGTDSPLFDLFKHLPASNGALPPTDGLPGEEEDVPPDGVAAAQGDDS
ncbi:MAG: protease modulator HflC [Opitutales bacterium]